MKLKKQIATLLTFAILLTAVLASYGAVNTTVAPDAPSLSDDSSALQEVIEISQSFSTIDQLKEFVEEQKISSEILPF